MIRPTTTHMVMILVKLAICLLRWGFRWRTGIYLSIGMMMKALAEIWSRSSSFDINYFLLLFLIRSRAIS